MELAARMIADTVEEGQGRKIVVEKSTVPVKAAESISNILRHNIKPGVTFQVGIGLSSKPWDCQYKFRFYLRFCPTLSSWRRARL